MNSFNSMENVMFRNRLGGTRVEIHASQTPCLTIQLDVIQQSKDTLVSVQLDSRILSHVY